MEKGDKLIILRDDEKPLQSKNTAMVAALLKLGIKLDADCAYLETREVIGDREQRTVTWVLKHQSEDGLYDTRKMIAAWHSEEWCRLNPAHPLAIQRDYYLTHQRLINVIKGVPPCAVVRNGKRQAIIPLDASPERRKELLDGLNK